MSEEEGMSFRDALAIAANAIRHAAMYGAFGEFDETARDRVLEAEAMILRALTAQPEEKPKKKPAAKKPKKTALRVVKKPAAKKNSKKKPNVRKR